MEETGDSTCRSEVTAEASVSVDQDVTDWEASNSSSYIRECLRASGRPARAI